MVVEELESSTLGDLVADRHLAHSWRADDKEESGSVRPLSH
jgi:hypothetical protein